MVILYLLLIYIGIDRGFIIIIVFPRDKFSPQNIKTVSRRNMKSIFIFYMQVFLEPSSAQNTQEKVSISRYLPV